MIPVVGHGVAVQAALPYLNFKVLHCRLFCLQCFDAVGWAAARKGIRPVKN